MSRRRPPSEAGDLVAALDTVTTLGPGRADEDVVAAATALRQKVDERLARGEGLTVAALAGGTGVGKSALLNAVLGQSIAVEGARRPTTSVPLAALPRETREAAALLDWLEVPARKEVGDTLPDGLVLLDLPDHDSVVESHRRTAARLAERVDVVLWVVDPIKYSRDDTHRGPLAAMTAHAEVLLVVLNRVDELSPEAVDACVRDLEERLVDGGHADARVVRTSAETGEGVDDLRRILTDIADRRTAARARLSADAAVVGARLDEALEPLPEIRPEAGRVVDEVLDAVDAEGATAEAMGLYQRAARDRTRSPLARLAGAPLRFATRALTRGGAAPPAPPPRAATVTALETALLRGLDVGRAVGHTHAALERAVESAADRAAPALTDAVAAAEPMPRRRAWWSAMALARLIAEAVALVGFLWLVAVAVVEWLQLPDVAMPEAVGALPWPTTLLLGGLLARLLLGLLTRMFIAAGARRHADRVRRRIARQIREVIESQLLEPVRQELEAQQRLRDAALSLHRARPG